MTDFSKILDKAKELEAKMKESQKKIKEIRVEGVSGSNSVKIVLDGEGEMQKINREIKYKKNPSSVHSDGLSTCKYNIVSQKNYKNNPKMKRILISI